MNLSLPARIQKLIDDRVRSGRYPSAEDVIAAALTHLDQHEQQARFPPAVLNAMVEEGEADIARGDVIDADTAFHELRRVSAARRASNG